jgi:hypothetical protein
MQLMLPTFGEMSPQTQGTTQELNLRLYRPIMQKAVNTLDMKWR